MCDLARNPPPHVGGYHRSSGNFQTSAKGIRGEMSKIICICPTHRDHRELSNIKNGHVFLHHDYASVGLEDLTAKERPSEVFIGDPEQEIDAILKRCGEEHVQGVITT